VTDNRARKRHARCGSGRRHCHRDDERCRQGCCPELSRTFKGGAGGQRIPIGSVEGRSFQKVCSAQLIERETQRRLVHVVPDIIRNTPGQVLRGRQAIAMSPNREGEPIKAVGLLSIGVVDNNFVG
jgi:hypothetical protein